MRIFVTGASGFIGTAVLPELVSAGHDVTGLARSEESARKIGGLGAKALLGDLADGELLTRAAGDADAVIHLAYNHDFTRFADSAEEERVALEAIADGLVGREGTALIAASGVLGLKPGSVATEQDLPGGVPGMVSPRAAGHRVVESLGDRGVRTAFVRLAPVVHDGAIKRSFVARLIDIARETGVSAYVGEGTNRWSAVHRLDAGSLFALAAEKAPAGAVLHGVADEGVELRTIAEAIGRHLDVPVESVTPEDAPAHFTYMAPMLSGDAAASSAYTQELLGWKPTHPSLLEDLENGCWFE